MLLAFVLYISIGIGLAVATLSTPSLRRHIDGLANRLGMSVLYARVVWLGGTTVAWPVGLTVFATGRLFLLGDNVPQMPRCRSFSIDATWNRGSEIAERRQSI